MSQTDQYAVVGNPVAHSKSPRIHTLFAQQTGQSLTYTAMLVEPGEFESSMSGFRDAGGKGINITVPFKQEAFVYATNLSPRAEHAGAVNTLSFEEDGEIIGDNTDGVGLVRDLTDNHRVRIAGQRILLLGAGGAARGAAGALLEEGPAYLLVANRTPERATELARLCSEMGRIEGCGLEDVKKPRFDVVINATSASLNNTIPEFDSDVVGPETFCYDMMYGNEPTVFMRWCEKQGVKNTADGLGMLVEQAAESFYVWRGIMPDTGPVIHAIRNRTIPENI